MNGKNWPVYYSQSNPIQSNVMLRVQEIDSVAARISNNITS